MMIIGMMRMLMIMIRMDIRSMMKKTLTITPPVLAPEYLFEQSDVLLADPVPVEHLAGRESPPVTAPGKRTTLLEVDNIIVGASASRLFKS